MMAKKHWQIVKHASDGKALEGGYNTMSLGEAPPAVIDVVPRAQLIGNGLYGVDIKETAEGLFAVGSTTIPTSSTASRTRREGPGLDRADQVVHRLAG